MRVKEKASVQSPSLSEPLNNFEKKDGVPQLKECHDCSYFKLKLTSPYVLVNDIVPYSSQVSLIGHQETFWKENVFQLLCPSGLSSPFKVQASGILWIFMFYVQIQDFQVLGIAVTTLIQEEFYLGVIRN